MIFFFFREQNFRDWKATHENHENFPPRNFSAIRYIQERFCVQIVQICKVHTMTTEYDLLVTHGQKC